MDDVIAVSAGHNHSLAITSNGNLYAFGRNNNWQLGDDTTIDRHSPIHIMYDVIDISAGGSHSMAIKADGSLWAWGSNSRSQLGLGPIPGNRLSVPTFISDGYAMSVAAVMVGGYAMSVAAVMVDALGLDIDTIINILDEFGVDILYTDTLDIASLYTDIFDIHTLYTDIFNLDTFTIDTLGIDVAFGLDLIEAGQRTSNVEGSQVEIEGSQVEKDLLLIDIEVLLSELEALLTLQTEMEELLNQENFTINWNSGQHSSIMTIITHPDGTDSGIYMHGPIYAPVGSSIRFYLVPEYYSSYGYYGVGGHYIPNRYHVPYGHHNPDGYHIPYEHHNPSRAVRFTVEPISLTGDVTLMNITNQLALSQRPVLVAEAVDVAGDVYVSIEVRYDKGIAIAQNDVVVNDIVVNDIVLQDDVAASHEALLRGFEDEIDGHVSNSEAEVTSFTTNLYEPWFMYGWSIDGAYHARFADLYSSAMLAGAATANPTSSAMITGAGATTTPINTTTTITYTFDNRGNRTTMTITGEESSVTTYTYGLNNRLLSFTKTATDNGQGVGGQGQESNQGAGQGTGTTTTETTTITYDRNGNQLLQTTISTTIGEDGNTQTQRQVQHNFYNAFNQLREVITSVNNVTTIMASYRYRPDGLRSSKTVNDVVTHHVWDRGNIVLELGNSSGGIGIGGSGGSGGSHGNSNVTVINRFDRGARGQLINSYHHGVYLHNARGDVSQRVSIDVEQGSNRVIVLHTYQYTAFGNLLNQNQPLGSELNRLQTYLNPDFSKINPNTNPFRFAGEYWDWETGTYYLRARHFNPRTGRFTQPDPHWHLGNMIFGDSSVMLSGRLAPDRFAIMQSGNLFMYTMHNPVMFVDPSGRFALLVELAARVIAAAVGGGGAAAGASAGAGRQAQASASNMHEMSGSTMSLPSVSTSPATLGVMAFLTLGTPGGVSSIMSSRGNAQSSSVTSGVMSIGTDDWGTGGGSSSVTSTTSSQIIDARDQAVAEVRSWSSSRRNDITTIVAEMDITTGQVAVDMKSTAAHGGALCAEDLVVAQLMLSGSQLNNIVMTPAVRPRIPDVVPVCHRCQIIYSRSNFLPGTPYRPGGQWDIPLH